MWFSVRLASMALLVALTACSSTGCDPSRAGFLEGIGCANGGYQQREAVLDQGLAQAQANQLEQRAQATAAANTAVAAQAELAARRREVVRLDGRLASLRQQLQVAAARSGGDQEAIRRVSAEMAELSRQQDAARRSPMDADMRAIEDRQRKVAKLLDDLD
jgi:hypothetical protein